MCARERLTWKYTAHAKTVCVEARGATHALSQHCVFVDDGTLHSSFEKLPYYWTHESMMNTIVDGVLDAVCAKRAFTPTNCIDEHSLKLAFIFSHVKLARGYNVLDVEISDGSWKGREGHKVRATVGDYAQVDSATVADAGLMLRGCVGPIIYADTLALHIAKYRHVFSHDSHGRRRAYLRMLHTFEYMENCDLGLVVQKTGQWPCFVKRSLLQLSTKANKMLAKWMVPTYTFPAKALCQSVLHRISKNRAGVRTNVLSACQMGGQQLQTWMLLPRSQGVSPVVQRLR